MTDREEGPLSSREVQRAGQQAENLRHRLGVFAGVLRNAKPQPGRVAMPSQGTAASSWTSERRCIAVALKPPG